MAWMPVVLALLVLFGLPGPDRNPQGLIFEVESEYNYIQVLERDGYRFLRLNEGQGIHSIYKSDITNFYGPWEQFLTAPFFNSPPYQTSQVKRIAIVGLAAGTTARAATLVYGPIPIDGFEIDAEIIKVGRTYFDMTEPNLTAIAQDGRWGLEHSPYLYQLICVDAYRPPYIPWHLTTREFFQGVQSHLAPDGVVAINVGRAPGDRRLIDAMGSTMASVFASVFVMDLPDTFNSIIFATNQPASTQNLVLNYSSLTQQEGTSPILLDTLAYAIANLTTPPIQAQVMTDDLAPIEWLTNSLVINTLLSGEIEDLK
jgi:spermidine synthase